MIGKIDKLQDLDYNEIAALSVIQKDKDLCEIFGEFCTIDIAELKQQSLEKTISDDVKQSIKNLFDKIILSKPLLIDWYLRAFNSDTKDITPDKTEKADKNNKLPRRFGKQQILTEISKQNGKATNAQLTALEVNNLKNIWANLSSRMIREMLGTATLTDVDYREIRATIKILETKIKPILNKK